MSQSTAKCSRMLVPLLMCCFCCAQTAAQSSGDYDGNGVIDGDDFFALASCMTGPIGDPPGAGCDAFDFGNTNSGMDGFVDMADFAALQRSPTGPTGCTFGRKYSQVQKTGPATRIYARIETKPVTLCQEGVASTNGKSSNATATVLKVVGTNKADWKWAQVGYIRLQNPGSTTVTVGLLAEVRAGPVPATDDSGVVVGGPLFPQTGFHEYECRLTSAVSGDWLFFYDEVDQAFPAFHSFQHSGWMGVTGTDYVYGAEIANKEDQMVGINAVGGKCTFKDCKVGLAGGGLMSTSFQINDDNSSDRTEWQVMLGPVNAQTQFQVWDMKP